MSIKPEANANWNFKNKKRKLLALGVHNQDTSDMDAIIESRHSRKAEIMDRLQLQPDDIVMDLGSGMGFVSEIIAPEVTRLHCCDISDDFLADCRERLQGHSNIEYHHIAYANLENVRSKNINKAFATLLFIHFNFYDIVYYLQEINKVLTLGGLFYFDFNDGERYQLDNKDDSFQEHIAIYKESREVWVFGCMHMTSFGILKNLIPQLGFRIVDHWTTPISFSQMTIEKIADI